tara:strand:+ start:318 stop:512 length:195 start_codon:yes stop_codon:yes gene_type:complete
MSGDNFYSAQPLKFYSEEMTKTKKIALDHLQKKLCPRSNSIIHLQRKYQETRVPVTAWEVQNAA